LRAQYDNVRSNGVVDATFFTGILPGYNNSTADVENWDDYRKESLMLKAIYNVSKKLSFAAGYAYERFKYEDAALDNYPYYFSVSNTNVSYWTGVYSEPSYTANVVFASVAYKF
jgi:hypothetical protein